MKRIFILSLFMLLSLSVKAQESVVVIGEDRGSITLRVTAQGKSAIKAVESAEVLGLTSILFRGVPSSKYIAKPMVGVNEEQIVRDHRGYFKSLFNERLSSFVTSATTKTKIAKDATKKRAITVDLRYNTAALKADLEANSVIRKFGL
ncbi:MAG: hypothetical protein SNH79_01070 [Rikenellaceae bacterium]